MKVICAGFPKTGTKSLTVALKILGYEVYDYTENCYYLGKEWNKILKSGGTTEDFRKMYENVDATIDIPVCCFWDDMLEAFPDAKVIFTTRDNEMEWLQSWEKQALSNVNLGLMLLALFSPTCQRCFATSKHIGRIVFGSDSIAPWYIFQGISSTVALKRFRMHNSYILNNAPTNNFLKFNVREGWAPLCNFLGKPIPNKPFPHENKKAKLVEDLLDYSPVFALMKKEMYVCFAVFVALFAFLYFYDTGIHFWIVFFMLPCYSLFLYLYYLWEVPPALCRATIVKHNTAFSGKKK